LHDRYVDRCRGAICEGTQAQISHLWHLAWRVCVQQQGSPLHVNVTLHVLSVELFTRLVFQSSTVWCVCMSVKYYAGVCSKKAQVVVCVCVCVCVCVYECVCI